MRVQIQHDSKPSASHQPDHVSVKCSMTEPDTSSTEPWRWYSTVDKIFSSVDSSTILMQIHTSFRMDGSELIFHIVNKLECLHEAGSCIWQPMHLTNAYAPYYLYANQNQWCIVYYTVMRCGDSLEMMSLNTSLLRYLPWVECCQYLMDASMLHL